MDKKWDIIVAGGGLAGTAAALSAAKNNCKVLLIEKLTFLGGNASGSLVTPMMKNFDLSGEGKGLYNEILKRLGETGDSALHPDGNAGWFNPEMLKFVLDELCEENGIQILFDTLVVGAETYNNLIYSINCINKAGFQRFQADFYIDATGDADLAAYAGVPFESDVHQAMSLRFIMENVNLYKFAEWILDLEPEMILSSVEFINSQTILLTTAHTNENIGWKLRPYFVLAIKNGVIKPEDAEYFQIFSIPGQINAIAFNCPRIFSKKVLDPLNQHDISYAYIQGRKQIKRIANFCKNYLLGFEDAYISQVAPLIGIRDSRRIKGIYKLTESDILSYKKFDNPVARSNYPIDVHGTSEIESEHTKLSENDYYEIPIEALLPENVSNLAVVGKCLSATFKAQASARIQPNCIAMGESAGIYVANIIKQEKNYV